MDESTRKLKREYINSMKNVWQHQKMGWGSLASKELLRTKSLKAELERRGWFMP